jgi:hypothetical protein
MASAGGSRAKRSIGLVLAFIVVGTLMYGAPAAQAHGSCTITGGASWWPAGGIYGGPMAIIADAFYTCDGSHRRSAGEIKLQIYKSGSWQTIASTNASRNPNCCDRKQYRLTTYQDFCEAWPSMYTWRVFLPYWRLYNANGTIAHSVTNKVAKQWSMGCVG